MSSIDAIVIGAGLFGSVIAAELEAQGRTVMMIDDMRPDAGSRPAACLMKPSWFSSLGPEVYEPSLELLDRHYGVQDLEFKMDPLRAIVRVHWCDPRKILNRRFTRGTVEAVTRLSDKVHVIYIDDTGERVMVEAPLVVVAAGIWSAVLAPVEGGLKGQAGMAFLWPGAALPNGNFIKPWAPYKQVVAFERGDGVWAGDGNAIIPQNWTERHEQQGWERCAGAIGRLGRGDREAGRVKKLFGIRPYSKAKPCYLAEAAPGLWVATGGAKNGTIAAGWCAHEIARRTA